VIEIKPPGPKLETSFSATPISGDAPLSVEFTDLTTGGPTEWLWDFGDGGNSTVQNPGYIYAKAGQYTVTLTVWNASTMSQTTKMNYITVINHAISETDIQFSGLTITNCGGPQTIMVNTSILTAALSSGNSVLEIQAPPQSGFKNITFYALNGGFNQNGDLITGNPTGVHLVSEEIAPPSGFSDTIGKSSSFMYIIDLPAYPCNANLITEIWEGVIPEYDIKLQNITAGQTSPAVSIGTAYTAKITKTNFPSGAQAKIYMSVDSGWNTNLAGGPGDVYIWRIADDGNSGQILPTKFLYTDPVTNLAYYEADSPLGFSTFGISSLTGANNPFQMVAFVAAQVINEGGNIQSSAGSGSGSGSGTSVSTIYEPGSPTSEMQGGGIVVPAPTVTLKAPALSQPAMTTNVGMVGWLLAIIQDYPIILVGVAGVIGAAVYFGWYKRRL
jgi:PKD repeat protein